jgi:hypothetical protein
VGHFLGIVYFEKLMIPSPHDDSRRMIGGVVQIWWRTVHGRRFAVSVEVDMVENTCWVLWMQLNGKWERQLFSIQGEDLNDGWHPLDGIIQGTAVVYDGWDLYLIPEHHEAMRQMAWLVYVLGEREPKIGEEALLLLELWVPKLVDWEAHHI